MMENHNESIPPAKRPQRNKENDERGITAFDDDTAAESLQLLLERLQQNSLLADSSEASEVNDGIQSLARDHPRVFSRLYCFRKKVDRISSRFLRLSKSGYEVGMARTPLEVVTLNGNATFETIKSVADAYPNALVTDPVDRGLLPIHMACDFVFVRRNIVEFLCERQPKSLLIKDRLKRTPLHIACVFAYGTEYSRDLVSCLLKFCPEATIEKDCWGRTPLLILLSAENHTSTTALQIAVDMVKAFPSCASIQDQYNWFPLSRALRMVRGCDGLELEAILEIFKAFPEAPLRDVFIWESVHSKIRDSMIAYHLSWSCGVPVTYMEAFPLHAVLLQRIMKDRPSHRLIDEVLNTHQDRSSHLDNHFGCLPLHLAISDLAASRFTTGRTITITMALRVLDLEPRAALVRAGASVEHGGRLYPFMAAACLPFDRRGGWLDLIYRLLRVDVQKLTSGALQNTTAKDEE